MDCRTKKTVQLAMFALILCTLVLRGNLSATHNRGAQDDFPAAEDDMRRSTVEARDLPLQEYLKLKRSALTNAGAQGSARIRNPRLSSAGVDLTVSAILDEQQRYLRHSEHVRTASLHRDSLTRGMPGAAPALGLLCLTPAIASVNGRSRDAAFTPQFGHNHYRIEGCGFGNVRGEVRLVSDSNVTSMESSMSPIALLPDGPNAWSDHEIDVRLDPRLAGLPDSSATLLVRLGDGRQVEFPHCRFVAVRGEPVALRTIPASWVKLNVMAQSRPLPQLEYVSPPAGADEIPPSATKMSALVLRSDSDSFDGGSDNFEFSGLNPGWAVESVHIQKYSVACPGDVTRIRDFGEWNTGFHDSGFTVQWGSSTCSSFIPPTFQFGMAWSEYALTVWVTGPVGTEPIANVRASHHEQN